MTNAAPEPMPDPMPDPLVLPAPDPHVSPVPSPEGTVGGPARTACADPGLMELGRPEGHHEITRRGDLGTMASSLLTARPVGLSRW